MIIGIDEVGRGCWAGPLVACAAAMDETQSVAGLNDSKVLTKKQRIRVVDLIQKSNIQVGIGWVWPSELNNIGLTKSVQLAMVRAVKQLDYKNHKIIIDGNINYLQSILCNNIGCSKDYSCNQCKNMTAVVKADGTIKAVSAASVVAKVARDSYMVQVAQKYKNYGFENHVGYGTKQHHDALKKYGVSPIHRINYKPIQALL